MAASLLGLGLFLGGARAFAQELPPLPPLPEPAPGSLALPPIPNPVPPLPEPAPGSIALPPAPTPEIPTLPPPRKAKTLHFSRDPVPQPKSAAAVAETTATARPQPQRVAVQAPAAQRARDQRKEQQAEESVQYTVPTEVPGLQRLSKSIQSDDRFFETLRQEKRSQSTVERIVFPEEVPLSKVAYAGRRWDTLKEEVQPSYVIYRRLAFEQKNAERYGWDYGVVQPLIETLDVYRNVALIPYHLGKRPFQQFECSAGYCLPGDPVPLMLYPPELSLSGSGLEAAILIPLFFAFP